MGFLTNRGVKLILDYVFSGVALPTNFYAALLTNGTTPTVDISTLGGLSQMAVGNGYTDGGLSLTPGTTDFPTNAEDDTNDYATLALKTLIWNPSGTFPASGALPQYVALTTDEATVANRQVIAVFDAVVNSPLANGQPLEISNTRIRLSHTPGTAFFTNWGLKLMMDWVFRAFALPTSFYAALTTGAPTQDTNTLSQLTEIPALNGYTAGGRAVARNSTNFPAATQNNTNDRAEMTSADIAWTASGGDFPSTGTAAHLNLVTDEATPGNRNIIFYTPVTPAGSVGNGSTLTIANAFKMRLNTA